MLPALEELLHLHKFETVYFLGDNDTCLELRVLAGGCEARQGTRQGLPPEIAANPRESAEGY